MYETEECIGNEWIRFSNNEEERRNRNKYNQWNIGNMSSIDSFSVRNYITCAAFVFECSFKFIYFVKI